MTNEIRIRAFDMRNGDTLVFLGTDYAHTYTTGSSQITEDIKEFKKSESTADWENNEIELVASIEEFENDEYVDEISIEEMIG